MDSENTDLDIWKVATGYVGSDWLKARRTIRAAAFVVLGKEYRGDDFDYLISRKDELTDELIKMRLKNG